MYTNVSPVMALSTTGAATTGMVGTTGMFTNPIWAVLAGFAILAAFTAVARIVPRRGTLAKGDPMRRLDRTAKVSRRVTS